MSAGSGSPRAAPASSVRCGRRPRPRILRYPDTRYVDGLIGPDTVNTLPEATIAAFEDHGRVARTIDADVDDARDVMRDLAAVGIDMDDVGLTLEDEGVASFHESFQPRARRARSQGRPTRGPLDAMDWAGWALFGLVATAMLTAVMIAAQLAGWTRLDLPLLLGTMVTGDPDRARVAGFFIHLAIGEGFALGYAAGFALLGTATWWLGALFGLVHVAIALTVLVPLLPGIHPRMASDRAGPASTAVLEPPGLFGLNYGAQTPASRSCRTWRLESRSVCCSRRIDMADGPRRPIGDYGLIGDTRTAALVSSDGAIDWMCVPRFDGDPLFGRLVGGPGAGTFRVGPARAGSTDRRRYRPGSATLETTWESAGGQLTLTEGMVAELAGRLLPTTLLVRRLTAEGGPVEAVVEFDPRARMSPRRAARRAPRRGLVCSRGSLAVALDTNVPLDIEPGRRSKVIVEPEQPLILVLAVANREPLIHVEPNAAWAALEADEQRWRAWTETIDADIPFRDAVVRSLLTLRLLTYSPSGAPVAAPTTSLPEVLGGIRNWDYRFAWPRDASIGIGAFLGAGKEDEAQMFLAWLLHASRLDRPRLPVLLTLHGKHPRRRTHARRMAGLRKQPARPGRQRRRQPTSTRWVRLGHRRRVARSPGPATDSPPRCGEPSRGSPIASRSAGANPTPAFGRSETTRSTTCTPSSWRGLPSTGPCGSPPPTDSARVDGNAG